MRILIPGGYGVFGRLLAQEILDSMSAQVVIAGRDFRRAVKACRALGTGAEPLALDLNNLEAVGRAADECFAVVCTAGPFQDLDLNLPLIAALSGAHWLDISDFDGWVVPLLANKDLHAISLKAKTVIMPGMSTVPALSGILARWGSTRVPECRRARVTLFIGNRNAKGTGAITSALTSGFHDPVVVDLPIGRRPAYRFHSPDKFLLGEDLALEGEFRVAFEWTITQKMMALAYGVGRKLGPFGRARLARWLSVIAIPFSWLGSNIGCVKAEVFSESGHGATCFLIGEGQRLAVLPCLLALEALSKGDLPCRGCLTPHVWLPPEVWIERLSARGVSFSGQVL